MPILVFDGADGTGKSTQLMLTKEWLEKKGYVCIQTREPGGTPFADEIRGLFKKVLEYSDQPLPLTELLLVMAARAQHVRKLLIPQALDKNKFILCDRFIDSTYVFQGILGGINKTFIDTVAKEVLAGIVPELSFIFTLPTEVAIARMQVRNAENSIQDRLDTKGEEFHLRINAGYKKLLQDNYPYPGGVIPSRIEIDAQGSIEELHAEICRHLQNKFGIP